MNTLIAQSLPPWFRGTIGGILAVLAVLPLPSGPLWFDEFFVANLTTFNNPLNQVLEVIRSGDAHPPLFYLYAWAYTHLVGLAGTGLNPPPEGFEPVFRAMNLLPVFLIGALIGLWLPPLKALLALGLLAGSESFVLKGQEARMYPWLAFFMLWGVYALVQRRPWLLSTTTLLAGYTHYLGLFFMGPLLLLGLWWQWKPHRWRGLAPLLPLLLYLPWVPTLFQQMQGVSMMELLRPASFMALYLYNGVAGHYVVTLALYALLFAGVWRGRTDLSVILPPLYIALFPLLWYLQSSLGPNTISERYFGSFLAVFVVSALLIAPAAWLRFFAYGLGVAACLAVASVKLGPPLLPNEDYRSMAAVLAKAEETGGWTVYGNEKGRLSALRYYHRSETPFVLPEDEEPLPERFFTLVMPGAIGTLMGERLLSMEVRALQAGYRRSVVQDGPLFFTRWEAAAR